MDYKDDSQDEVTRKRIYQHQIADVKADAKRQVLRITQEIIKDGILAPQLPLIVAQPFDKKPYVSVSDGRKIALYSHKEGILWDDTAKTTKRVMDEDAKRLKRLQYDAEGNDLTKAKNRHLLSAEDSERIDYLESLQASKKMTSGMHQYNVNFWPHTQPMHMKDVSTEQHDPLVNNFDAQNSHREVLYCQVCHVRLRIIHCKTCIRGYCFYCAFRTHTDATRRNHSMDMIEPRVVKVAEMSKSLIYHLGKAFCFEVISIV